MPGRRLVLYSKPGCHLCEDAEALLEDLAPVYGLSVDKIDITCDMALFERYRYVIPVVIAESGACVAGRISSDQLRALLA